MSIWQNVTTPSRTDGMMWPADLDASHDSIVKTTSLNVWFGDKRALEDVDMTVSRKRVTAIIGPSGCGKSTFLKALNRTIETEPGGRVDGEVLVDGADIYHPDTPVEKLRRSIGIVSQKPNPFPWSVWENVAYGPRIHAMAWGKRDMHEIVETALKRVWLWDEVKDRLDEPGTDLSGGQQQRLCIARAIAIDPDILLMDEPCSAIDPIATSHIEDLIGELFRDHTILIVTHNMQQAARVSHDAAFFHLGKLIEKGSTVRVFSDSQHQLTRDFVSGQFG